VLPWMAGSSPAMTTNIFACEEAGAWEGIR
jgi:hypothetical protein